MQRTLEIGHNRFFQLACVRYMHTRSSESRTIRRIVGLCMDWLPKLRDRQGPVYRRILDALAADVANGRLHRGQQLPTHRALAKALGIDLTTVTRAYTEARQRGLTEARVGRGTFVAESMSHVRHAAAPQPQLDLSMNLPPQPMEADLEGRFMRGMAAIQREVGFSAHLNYREA